MIKKVPLPHQLNICLIAKNFPILGRAADFGFLWPIARGLAQKGHKVTVLSSVNPQGKEEITQEGVKAFFLNEGKSARRRDTFVDLVRNKFIEIHRESPFHIVHSLDAAAYKIGRNKRHYGLAMAYDVQATQMSQIFAILGMAQETLGSLLSTGIAVAYKFLRTFYGGDRLLLKTADGVFVNNPQQRLALERYYLFPDVRIHTVPYGIEIGDLSPREKSAELRGRLGLAESTKTVVTLSDMTELSEVKNLLLAFERVAIKKPNSRLIIMGNGPLFKEIEYQMLMLALGNKVILTGAVKNTEIPDYIALADAYVNLSSRATGYEPSMLEAMAQKKVIIGSEVSPMTNIVENGKDGFLIRPADVPELANLLLEIFNGHISSLEIGESARRKVLNLFDTEKMVDETLSAYFNILRSTGLYRKS